MQAVTSKRPVLRVVKTSRYLEAWLLPRWVPLRLRDRVIAKKLGLTPLPPLDSEDEAEAAEEATEEPPKSASLLLLRITPRILGACFCLDR